MTTATVLLPPKLADIFWQPRGSAQYRAAFGGRGSGKSQSFAKMAAVFGYAEPLRILCTREFQVSIRESMHAELKAAIASEPWLEAHYDVGVDYLRGRNGTEFIFRGLRHGIGSIKSLAKIDLTIVEEAEDVPEVSWLALEATVFRQPKSELWPIWNPRLDGSPVDLRFRKNPPTGALIAEVNWQDNPFFPPNMEILRRREQERLDPNTYSHVWEGAYLTNSDAQVFGGKWSIAEFEPASDWDGPYQGGDFGFSQDPTAAVRAYISGDSLYISHEAGRTGLELDDTAAFVTGLIPKFAEYITRWDSASPGSISLIRRYGLANSVPVEKWAGSVEDGVRFLRSFKRIVVHPRCTAVAQEMRLYSYKVDRLSGDVLPDIVDAWNHYCIAEGEVIRCERGDISVEQVTTNDRVQTRDGYRTILFAGQTGVDKQTLRVVTTVGAVTCTPEHRIWTQRGFVRADALRYADEIIGIGELACADGLNGSNGTAGNTGDIPTVSTFLTAAISSGLFEVVADIFTGIFGKNTTVPCLMGVTFITSIKTAETTISRIWDAFLGKTIRPSIHTMTRGLSTNALTSNASALLPKAGTPATPAGKSIGRLGRWLTSGSLRRQRRASNVEYRSFPENSAASIGSAPTLARARGGEPLASMTRLETVPSAGSRSSSTDTRRPGFVRGHVLTVREAGTCPRVYDLTVDGAHEFFAGGVLVHNCDALRYALAPMIKSVAGEGVMEFYRREAAATETGSLHPYTIGTQVAELGPSLVLMRAPENISTAFGQTGRQYNVTNGQISVDPDDVRPFEASGFTRV